MFARGPQAVLPALRCCHLGLSVLEVLRHHVKWLLKWGLTEPALCTYVSSPNYPQRSRLIPWLTRCKAQHQEGQVLCFVCSCCRVHLKIQRNPLILWVRRAKDTSARMGIWEATSAGDYCCQSLVGSPQWTKADMPWVAAACHSFQYGANTS